MAKPSPKPKQTTAIDHGVGSRIAFLRAANGLSQSALASALGVSFQQVQKYETGKNRVGAGRLQAIAERLGVPVSSFFEPEPASATENGPSLLRISGAVELLRAYNQIGDDQMRRDVLSLVKSAARIGFNRTHDGSAPEEAAARGTAPSA
ncbi:Transcriptional regulator, contains XRE-family HTH domain [Methylobacterium phyllostachyos]|uniref:Transcriptional regulator, contains XRE-family HTH domain n=1 Tax=Methylobacterium phyllostachyos TaxID=582672 RepID=A0A1G9VIP0_9HYPH|nr:helix-turn-helix transcriptional regulator [Methylobacterium phyllostachyos]SDM71901.1 Transcriptional regulator, contains XRE-family HTH domain [Methylobacterium phyllostachyos]